MPILPPPDALRIDRVLWHLRFAKSRTIAQGVIEQGHVRVNQRRVLRTSEAVHAGDVITMIRGETAIAIRITKLPPHRVSAADALEFYDLLA